MKLDANMRYEIKSEAFRIMTGHMSPGKDPSPASYPAPFEERFKAFEDWNKENGECIKAVLLAVERLIDDEELP